MLEVAAETEMLLEVVPGAALGAITTGRARARVVTVAPPASDLGAEDPEAVVADGADRRPLMCRPNSQEHLHEIAN